MKNFVLHVGPMKTSTTYVQNILHCNREYLRGAGWVYPGKGNNQQYAIYGICGSDIPWVKPAIQAKALQQGHQLIREIEDAKDSVIVSAEALASLSCSGIERLMRMIPPPDTVVFTHRPLEKLIPSAWQQNLKGGGTDTLSEYSNRILSQITLAKGNLYMGYALGDAIERWKSVVRSRIVLMKVPTEKVDASKTWPLFQKATGIPELKTSNVKEANSSLSMEAANLLRDFNISLRRKNAFSIDAVNVLVNDCLLKKRFGDGRVALEESSFVQVAQLERQQLYKAQKFVDEVVFAE